MAFGARVQHISYERQRLYLQTRFNLAKYRQLIQCDSGKYTTKFYSQKRSGHRLNRSILGIYELERTTTQQMMNLELIRGHCSKEQCVSCSFRTKQACQGDKRQCSGVLVINAQVTFIIRTYFPMRNPGITATYDSAENA